MYEFAQKSFLFPQGGNWPFESVGQARRELPQKRKSGNGTPWGAKVLVWTLGVMFPPNREKFWGNCPQFAKKNSPKKRGHQAFPFSGAMDFF